MALSTPALIVLVQIVRDPDFAAFRIRINWRGLLFKAVIENRHALAVRCSQVMKVKLLARKE
jgi:hypothetical protein